MYSPRLIATALNGPLVYRDDEEVQAKMLSKDSQPGIKGGKMELI
jgi:hypothetical protein